MTHARRGVTSRPPGTSPGATLIALIAVTLLAASSSLRAAAPEIELGIAEALSIAEENAPAIVAARLRLALMDGDIAEADALFAQNPQLNVRAGPRFGSASDANADTNANALVSLDIEASLQQQLEIAGEPVLRRDVAARSKDVLAAELDATRARVRTEVRAAFSRALVARVNAEATIAAASLSDDLLRMSEARVAAGDLSPLAVPLARADLASARQAATVAIAEARSRALALAELAGMTRVPTHFQGAQPALGEVRDADVLVARALDESAALAPLVAARARAEAHLAFVERSSSWLSAARPAIGASYAAERLPSGPLAGEHIVLGTLQVELPSWQRNQGALQRARTELALVDAALIAERRSMSLRMRASVDALSDAVQVVRLMDAELPGLDGALQQIRRAFQLGELDALAVTSARDKLVAATRGALAARLQHVEALAAIERDLGRELRLDELVVEPIDDVER